MTLPCCDGSPVVILLRSGPQARVVGHAMVLGKLPVAGRPTSWMIVGQGSIALVVGAGAGCLDLFSLLYLFSSFSLSPGDGPI